MKFTCKLLRQFHVRDVPILPATIILKFEKEWFHYYAFRILLPVIDNTNEVDMFDGTLKEIYLTTSFDTSLKFCKSPKHWSFSVELLGFGISTTKQWGY